MRVPAPSQPLPLIVDRLSDRLAALLSAQIESGALHAGDRLPTEQKLAEAHGVSRTVVREAVHQLKSKGMVNSRQGSGVYVAPRPVNQALAFDPTVLTSVQAVVHVVEVRRVLEGEIAALAAERASRSQIAELRRALKAIDEAVADGRDGVAEDLAFHRVIGEATGNPQFRLLLGFLEQYLREGMRITRGNEARRLDFMTEVQREHRAIFEAISARDPDAARRRATEHITRGEQRLIEGGVIDVRRRQAAAKAVRDAAATTARKGKKAMKESP
ncbi:FadR/GntR family transcriptional regulator [Variovorax sp. Sphag1AA]|uniref:FadR/GntR family transcriptional regulator n=1 Tax=Variovorax sp. Sphag1AA TaxID=2587027 RepID=UPI001610E80B|nr:FadR/GntR family transcriptional regulator [Variovorax sp. Sphag1AA]MBB3179232.1 GntR family transcriptional repressor for pyruvate dehydrogenase complex [Variovorax sp. Sphag1AA]